MTQGKKPPNDADRTPVYEIRIKERMGLHWQDWFAGMAMTYEDGETVLSGPVVDQSALHGLLKMIRDLGLTLISVNRMDASEGGEPGRTEE